MLHRGAGKCTNHIACKGLRAQPKGPCPIRIRHMQTFFRTAWLCVLSYVCISGPCTPPPLHPHSSWYFRTRNGPGSSTTAGSRVCSATSPICCMGPRMQGVIHKILFLNDINGKKCHCFGTKKKVQTFSIKS